MCGITGWIDWTNDISTQRATLEQMAQTLQSRGPDAHGYWLSSRTALAHRRLIVIDPECGGQPMVYQQGERTYAITYNGEIYNFRELRSELESRGHTFHTKSDTEVILHAYAEWGEECVKHLNGIFAFALWDEHRQKLLLARDHLGVKPLFYAERGSSLVFGSELKSLLAHPLVEPEVGVEGLAEIFAFGMAKTPGVGIYRDVHELRAGHLAVCDHNGIHIRQYWKLLSAPHTDDLPTTAASIRSLLEDTVRRQLIADVPLVSLLSGGLDSSGLCALATREFQREGKTLHTYSVDFVNNERDFQPDMIYRSMDEPYVQQMVRYLKTEHHTVVVDTPELVENLLAPLYARDVPGMGQADTSMYLLFKAMKQDATVSLSGESADEVFGGYPWFFSEEARNADTFPWATNRQSGTFLSPELEQAVCPAEYVQRRYREALAEVPRLEGEIGLEARMREIFYLNITRFLGVLLARKDLMSMASGFEVRVPFCDHRLVEYVWNIPWEMKTTGNIEKGILREAFADLLPDDVRCRRKSPYPSTHNPGYTQAVSDWALTILNDPNAPIHALVDTQKARAILGQGINIPMKIVANYVAELIIQANAWLRDYHIRIVV